MPAKAQNQNIEVIHHPNYDKNVFMPFVPAIKIKSGNILWLAGTTALPVYHDHPHKRDQTGPQRSFSTSRIAGTRSLRRWHRDASCDGQRACVNSVQCVVGAKPDAHV